MRRDDVPIEKRCDQRWNDLRGTGSRRRHCESCATDVINLSSMTEAEAQRFLDEVRAPVCLMYRYDSTGRITFRPDPQKTARVSRLGASAAVVALAVGGCTYDSAVGPSDAATEDADQVGMDAMVAVDSIAPVDPGVHDVAPTALVLDTSGRDLEPRSATHVESHGPKADETKPDETKPGAAPFELDCEVLAQLTLLGYFDAPRPRCDDER
jgi:hypothetical protein